MWGSSKHKPTGLKLNELKIISKELLIFNRTLETVGLALQGSEVYIFNKGSAQEKSHRMTTPPSFE